jgi:hypothetical protein
MAPVLEGKSIGWDQNTSAKRRAGDLKNQESGSGPSYTPTQAFNLLHMSPNWFLGNSTPGPSSKVGLTVFYCKTLLSPYVENHRQHD